jgi:hypothetical protein
MDLQRASNAASRQKNRSGCECHFLTAPKAAEGSAPCTHPVPLHDTPGVNYRDNFGDFPEERELSVLPETRALVPTKRTPPNSGAPKGQRDSSRARPAVAARLAVAKRRRERRRAAALGGGIRFGLFTQSSAPLALGYHHAVPTGLGSGSLRGATGQTIETAVERLAKMGGTWEKLPLTPPCVHPRVLIEIAE